jgi:endoglucanase
MKKIRLVFLLFAVLILAVSCSKEDEEVILPVIVPTEAIEFVKGMGLGVNIGNTFDSLNVNSVIGETGWGNPQVTLAYIQSLKGHGFKTVRVPISWIDYLGPAPDYAINNIWMTRVETVVNWILAEDMYCIINLHHDGGGEINEQGNINAKYWIKQISLPGKEDEITARFVKVWEQIAEHFRDAPETLIFEGMNEIGFDNMWDRYQDGQAAEKAEAYRLVNKLNQVFVDAVRPTGGNNGDRYLLIAGYWTDIDCTIDPLFKMPRDTAKNRQIVSVHYYTPWNFCGGTVTTWGSSGQITALSRNMDKLKAPFISKGIPVILGEYSVNIRTSGTAKDSDSRAKWMYEVTQKCVDRGICPVLWDTGKRSNNNGMADIERQPPFGISDNLQYVFDNIVFPDAN